MEKENLTISSTFQIQVPEEQLNLIERNLEMSVDERIHQLQSAVELIEEMKASLKELNENRFQNSHK